MSKDISDPVVHRSLSGTSAIMLPAFILDILIVASVWEDGTRRWLAIGVCGVFATLNALLMPLFAKRIGHTQVSRHREWMNTMGQILKTVIAQASIPTWGFLLGFAGMTDRGGSVFSRKSVMILLVVQVAVSVYSGVGFLQIAALSAVTFMAMLVSVARSSVLFEAAADQKRQREKLEQLQQVATHQEKMSSLGMLAAGIAHEINNPMAFVTSNVHQLEKDFSRLCQSSELHEEYTREILPELKDGIVRVNTIVDDLRRFARGDVEARSSFDVNEVIQSAVRMTHGRVAPGVSVSLSLDPIPLQLGHPRQLSQVVVNLLVNAIQAVAEGGVIVIKSGCSPDKFWFSVSDNGPGMDKEAQNRVFEPFFTTKPIGEGTGLGLAVVHGIVEQLNGTISVESAPGKGAKFIVSVPRRNDGDVTGEIPLRSA